MFALNLVQNSEAWENYKSQPGFVSSTEVSSVLHCNQFKSRRMLFLEKLHLPYKKHQFESEALVNGRAKEPEALKHIMGRIDNICQYENKYLKPGIIRNWEYPNFICSPDLLVKDCQKKNEYMGIEVKNLWSRPIPQNFTEVPVEHLLQCFFACHVACASQWLLCYYDWQSEDHRGTKFFSVYPNEEIWKEICCESMDFIRQVLTTDRNKGLEKKTKAIKAQREILLNKIRNQTFDESLI